MTTLLGHVSKEVYCGIFAFGLTELEQLESLYGDEVGQVIYSAGVGAPVSIAQVEQELAQEAAQLYRPGARKPAINQLITELDELQEEITALRQRPEEYASVQREVQDLTTQLEDLEAQRRHLAEDLVWYRTLLSLWEQWEELFQIEQQLAKLPECFPRDRSTGRGNAPVPGTGRGACPKIPGTEKGRGPAATASPIIKSRQQSAKGGL